MWSDVTEDQAHLGSSLFMSSRLSRALLQSGGYARDAEDESHLVQIIHPLNVLCHSRSLHFRFLDVFREFAARRNLNDVLLKLLTLLVELFHLLCLLELRLLPIYLAAYLARQGPDRMVASRADHKWVRGGQSQSVSPARRLRFLSVSCFVRSLTTSLCTLDSFLRSS